MSYEINVSKLDSRKQYRHYFATHERSISNMDELTELLKHFMELFPEPQFNISVSEKIEKGIFLDVKKLMTKNRNP